MRYQNRVVTFLEHHTGNHELAKDLTQDVFMRVFRARKSYVPGAKFSTWLFTITHNVAKNALRSKSRRPEINLEGRDSGPLGIRPLEAMVEVSSGQIPARAWIERNCATWCGWRFNPSTSASGWPFC